MQKSHLSPISRTEKRIEDSITMNLQETVYGNVKDVEMTHRRVYWPNLVTVVYKSSG